MHFVDRIKLVLIFISADLILYHHIVSKLPFDDLHTLVIKITVRKNFK